MPEPPKTGDAVLALVRKSELADDDVLKGFLDQSGPPPATAADTATRLVQLGILTPFQARLILQGRHKGFRLGPYRILDQIGAGGMGQVYLAEHVHLHRRVALKVLPARFAADKAWVDRFYREARAVAALNDPNVVRAYDISHDKGSHFLVLEYVSGKSLLDLLAEAGGRLPVGQACGYAVQAAAGLHHAHEKGIAHRDVKPANLLVAPDGIVKLLDMGLAKFFEDPATSDPHEVMGTADYIAPEQAVGCAAADHRADVYSLGATLFHLVTGRPPFEGHTAAKLVAHQLQEAPQAHAECPDVPEALSEVIGKMMAKSPADRYPTAADAAIALLPFAEGVPLVSATPSGRLNAAAPAAEPVFSQAPIILPRSRSEKILTAALLVGIALLTAAIVAMLIHGVPVG